MSVEGPESKRGRIVRQVENSGGGRAVTVGQLQKVLSRVADRIRQAWILIRDRPIFTCPECCGLGGEESGYYEREFQECWACHDAWGDAEDHGMDWAVGRLGPLRWVRAWLGREWNWRCAIGWHDRDEYAPVCLRCWEDLP